MPEDATDIDVVQTYNFTLPVIELTTQDRELLARPFTSHAVGFRADQKNATNRVRCLVYIDSRLARERLSDVDLNWTARYDPGAFGGLECFVTVKGVTRSNVTDAPKQGAANSQKSQYSDALKRAAVDFHVGAYLYSLPTFWVDANGYYKKANGEVGGLNDKGISQLRMQYERAIATAEFKQRFGEPVDYGDAPDDERHAQIDDDEDPSAEYDVAKDDRSRYFKLANEAGFTWEQARRRFEKIGTKDELDILCTNFTTKIEQDRKSDEELNQLFGHVDATPVPSRKAKTQAEVDSE